MSDTDEKYRVRSGHYYCLRSMADDKLMETGEIGMSKDGKEEFWPDTKIQPSNPAATIPVTGF